MEILLVGIGPDDDSERAGRTVAGLRQAGAAAVTRAAVGAETAAVDEVLEQLAGRRLVIDADLAGLQLVLTRLMRRGELDSAETAVLPRGPIPYLDRLGLPTTLTPQLRTAVHGRPRLVGVIKDDSGGLSVDHARVSPWPADTTSRAWWVRAVVDDQRLVDGTDASSVRVTRIGPSELEATVRFGRWRNRRIRGRSLQLACDEALISQDGVDRERPRGKRTFWSEPKLWQLAL